MTTAGRRTARSGVGGIPVTCPKCNAEFPVSASAIVPDEQVIYLEMKGSSEYFAAKIIGKQILNSEVLIRSVAEEVGGNWVVFLQSIELKPGAIKIGFLLTAAPKKDTGRRGRGAGREKPLL